MLRTIQRLPCNKTQPQTSRKLSSTSCEKATVTAKQQSFSQQAALFTAGLAASFSLVLQPACAADALSIGEYVGTQQNLVGVDRDGNGTVSMEELSAAYLKAGATNLTDDVLRTDMNMYDLNADGVLSVSELNTASALDAIIGPDYIDGDLWNILDKNKDEYVSHQEWMQGLGDVGGQAGEDIKDLLFKKMDNVVLKDGQLDEEEVYLALQRLRNIVLGYDPTDYAFEEEPGFGDYAYDTDIQGLKGY